ncbi:MAG: tRNA pseudouridine(55) synthase TruB [Bacteroidota bacterium]
MVDKPIGWTSFDVVNKIRYALRKRYGQKKFKVGHAGTLDPLATGLLLICTGKWTKKLAELTGMPKTYTGTFAIGATTPSYDRETEVDQHFPTDHITKELIEKARESLTGDIEQLPPMFSAVKVDGQPLYKKARKGQDVERKARTVSIHEFRLGDFNRLPQVDTSPSQRDNTPTSEACLPSAHRQVQIIEDATGLDSVEVPHIDFLVSVSKGTYIRTLAYDFGHALHSGAYLSSLCRTHIGPYDLEEAWDLDALIEYINEGELAEAE